MLVFRLLWTLWLLTAPAAVPKEFYDGTVTGLVELPGGGNALLVRVPDLKKVVVLFIGQAEAQAIALRVHQIAPPRPLTHDLYESLLRAVGGRVERARIVEIRHTKPDGGGIFIGRLWIRIGGKVVEFDARASDTVALALGARVPIGVARKVAEQGTDEAELRGGSPPPGRSGPSSEAGRLQEFLKDRRRGPEDAM